MTDLGAVVPQLRFDLFSNPQPRFSIQTNRLANRSVLDNISAVKGDRMGLVNTVVPNVHRVSR